MIISVGTGKIGIDLIVIGRMWIAAAPCPEHLANPLRKTRFFTIFLWLKPLSQVPYQLALLIWQELFTLLLYDVQFDGRHLASPTFKIIPLKESVRTGER